MNEREAERVEFLERAGLSRARRDPLPGDASTRRYERLTAEDGRSLMLMDQAPAAESPPCDPAWSPERRRAEGWNATARLSAGRIEAFAAVADHLRRLGLSAPEIVALDASRGLAVLEDFGDALFARVLEAEPEREPDLYLAAVDVLIALHAAAPPELLTGPGGDWPLLAYDETALKGGADLFVEWWPKLEPSIALDAEAFAAWDRAWAPIIARGAEGATVVAHRDFHAENLIWLPERDGAARVGMIDFQDAVRAHPAWDLIHLLQDARRDVPDSLERLALDHYLAARPEVDRAAFLSEYRALAALNEARILGIFARLIIRDGKPRYRQFLPRMWAHLTANLTDPALAEVRAWFERYVPEETRA
ncbi:N-acetylmuramate/N-acetylglucosamine kinase AmgK [Brevundimonas lutea]|uniref:N-acetylmuramate/N-acetylglucosamine kinase AmgK n=1 Tax=Brevundimonas lutea TaxID=2293980 RepID=UPI000F032CC0